MAKQVPRVADVMSAVPVALRTDRTLDEAEIFLREYRVIAAPVLTPGGNFVGVLTDFQLLKCFLKRRQVSPQALVLGNYLTELEGVNSVGDYEPVSEGFKKMLLAPSRRVFVVDRDGKLKGMLEPSNLFSFMADREVEFKVSGKRRRMTGDGGDIPPALEEILFDEAPTPIYALDPAGKILAANRALHTLLGYEYGELYGKGMKDLYAQAHLEDAAMAVERVRELGYQRPTATQLVRKDQNLVKVDVISLQRYGDGGAAAGTVTVCWGTEAKSVLDILNSMTETLKPKPPGG